MEPGDPATLDGGWLRLAALRSAPSAARRHVTEWLNAHLADPSAVSDLALAVSELTTNVVQHTATSWVFVRISGDDPGWWTLEVVGGSQPLPPHLADPADWSMSHPYYRDGGRGLGIVRSVVDEIDVAEYADELIIRCRRSRVSDDARRV